MGKALVTELERDTSLPKMNLRFGTRDSIGPIFLPTQDVISIHPLLLNSPFLTMRVHIHRLVVHPTAFDCP